MSFAAALVDAGYAGAWRLSRELPAGLCSRVARVAADATTARNGGGVRQLRANLGRVLGPSAPAATIEAAVKAGMRSYARYWTETFRLPALDHEAILACTRATTEGTEHLDAAVGRGRGIVFALPHMGNWDIAALWLLDRGLPFATVVERLRPESLFRRFLAYRRDLGMEVLPLTGTDRPAAAVLAERLRAGGTVCLIADRNLAGRGVGVRMFGATTRFPAGPALLAATTGATLLPGCVWFTPDGWGQRVDAPIRLPEGRLRDRVQAGAQSLADVFAARIADHPSDWHILQPFFDD